MEFRNTSFVRGFFKGMLSPLAGAESMFGLRRASSPDPFKDIQLGSIQTDQEKIRHDFARALGKIHGELPQTTKNK